MTNNEFKPSGGKRYIIRDTHMHNWVGDTSSYQKEIVEAGEAYTGPGAICFAFAIMCAMGALVSLVGMEILKVVMFLAGGFVFTGLGFWRVSGDFKIGFEVALYICAMLLGVAIAFGVFGWLVMAMLNCLAVYGF